MSMSKKITELSHAIGFLFSLVVTSQAAELTQEELRAIDYLFEKTGPEKPPIEIIDKKSTIIATADEDVVKKRNDIKEKPEETARDIYYRISVPSNEDMEQQMQPLSDSQLLELARRIRALSINNHASKGYNND